MAARPSLTTMSDGSPMTSAPGPNGSGASSVERIDEGDDPGPVTEQDLDPDVVQQLAHAVEDLVRLDRVAPGILDLGVAGAGPRGLEHRVGDEPPPRGG